MNDSQEPHALLTTLNQVNDKDSFLNFVRDLIKDRSNPVDWENDTIEGFWKRLWLGR